MAPGSYNIGPEQVESVLSERTRAIVVAHLAGTPPATPVLLSPHDRGVSAGEMADIEGIMQVADRHGIPVIEDCAQAHGAAWHDGRTQHQPALLATPRRCV